MSELVTAPRFADGDAAFRALVEAHRGLTAEQSAALNARLVLLLANQIGSLEILSEAIRLATAAAPTSETKA